MGTSGGPLVERATFGLAAVPCNREPEVSLFHSPNGLSCRTPYQPCFVLGSPSIVVHGKWFGLGVVAC